MKNVASKRDYPAYNKRINILAKWESEVLIYWAKKRQEEKFKNEQRNQNKG